MPRLQAQALVRNWSFASWTVLTLPIATCSRSVLLLSYLGDVAWLDLVFLLGGVPYVKEDKRIQQAHCHEKVVTLIKA